MTVADRLIAIVEAERPFPGDRIRWPDHATARHDWQSVHRLALAVPALVENLDRLWHAVAAYGRIGYEGSELLEAMSEAKAALALARGEVTAPSAAQPPTHKPSEPDAS